MNHKIGLKLHCIPGKNKNNQDKTLASDTVIASAPKNLKNPSLSPERRYAFLNVWTINYLLSQSVPIQHSCASHWSRWMDTTDLLKLRWLIKDLAYKEAKSYEWISLENLEPTRVWKINVALLPVSHTVLTQQMQNIRDVSDKAKNDVEQVEIYHLQYKQYLYWRSRDVLNHFWICLNIVHTAYVHITKQTKERIKEVFIFRLQLLEIILPETKNDLKRQIKWTL